MLFNSLNKWFLFADGQNLPLNRRQKVFPNGTLIVEQTQRGEDAGTYTCQASNRQRHAARKDVEVQILGEYLFIEAISS